MNMLLTIHFHAFPIGCIKQLITAEEEGVELELEEGESSTQA